MSLPQIAKHLESHGRGDDTHLVHMTTGELKAMQKLAESKGGSLTINPSTGLPEAGFLSSILPMAIGAATAAFAPELLPLVAGGVGIADYALTGSLTQGLMAGLGAWGGGNLAGGLEAAGTQSLTQAGGDVGNAAFNASQSEIASQFPTATTESVNQVAAQQALTPSNFPNLSPDQLSQMQGSVLNAANPSSIVNAAGQANASLASNVVNPTFAQNLSNMGSGLSSIGSVISANPGATAAVAAPLLTGMLNKQRTTVPSASSTATDNANPMGLRTIPRNPDGTPNFAASNPTVPNPHYQASFPNYTQVPYNPMTGTPAVQSPGATIYAAGGGLMDIPKYSGADYGSMVTGANELQQGIASATMPTQLSESQLQQIAAGQDSSKNGVYQLSDTEYAKMSPTALMKAHKIAVAKGLQPIGQLGDFETTTAAQQAAEAAAQQDIADNSKNTSAKEGGLMAMADGGSPIYHPQYQDYRQTPYQANVMGPSQLQAAMAQYNSRTPLVRGNLSSISQGQPIGQSAGSFGQGAGSYTGTGPASTQTAGYAIDPLQMQGSPAYNAQQAQQALLDQIAQAALPSFGMASGGVADGGIKDGHLGSYSDGGRLLKGPGDGVSDGIPATIGGKQPARLADGEFVIPARIVSELGNGSTDAGAKRLYAMMDRIKAARAKTKDIAKDTKAYKYLPA